MPDIEKNEEPAPEDQPALPGRRRSRPQVQYLRRGISPTARFPKEEAGPRDFLNRRAAGPAKTALETATQIAAEFIAQDAVEKTKLAEENERAQLDLAREKNERHAADVEAEEKFAAVSLDLASAQEDAAAARKSLARERSIRIVAGIMVVAAISSGVIYRSVTWVRAPSAPPPAPSVKAEIARLLPALRTTTPGSQAQVTEGLDRLNYALASTAIGGPAQVLLALRGSKNPKVCPFVWRNGQVELAFAGGEVSLSSLAGSLSRCADAVEKLR